ncbi:hypothetical protein HPB51_021977 [Rhipicephalus microplus]|uniref:Uncharacterized protein n=1 Tax=Rhipicephalus microplus TaxID=6941 RepID=A0A9J6DWL3_RHIMP|nr:hypothetical protein HPB51_021977 [Rhipicephalus microplus]
MEALKSEHRANIDMLRESLQQELQNEKAGYEEEQRELHRSFEIKHNFIGSFLKEKPRNEPLRKRLSQNTTPPPLLQKTGSPQHNGLIFVEDVLYEWNELMKQLRSLSAIVDKLQAEKEDFQETLERATERVDTFQKEPAGNAE